jgi:TetR/AcrR family transcriptional repressor of lmrAB and yxaGH operons
VASDARDRMAAGAVRLLAQRGLQATSFSEVLAATGAPRGSIYHHFPEGKDQMVGAALELAGAHAIGAMESTRGRSAQEVVEAFLGLWRELLTRSQYAAGCAVVAVTVATDSEALLDQTARIFRDWRTQLADLLEVGGLPAADAPRFAATLVAASEGAVLLSRAERGLAPFDLVSEHLLTSVRTLQGS